MLTPPTKRSTSSRSPRRLCLLQHRRAIFAKTGHLPPSPPVPMAGAFTAASSLVDKSLTLIDRLGEFSNKYKLLPQDVISFKNDLKHINEAIEKRSQTADRDGIRSWIDDRRRIKLRIEDAVEYYDLMVAGGSCEGLFTKLGHRLKDWAVSGPETTLRGYIDEIKRLVAEAKKSVDAYKPPDHHQDGQNNNTGNEEGYRGHPAESKPVGLETPTKELVEMLSDATLLRVVAISGMDASLNSDLAKAAYDQVRNNEEFECNVWVKASEDGEKKLLQGLLDQLGVTHQESQNLIELRKILRNFLMGKRYIIGIDGLKAIAYWNNVVCAFPDDNTNSRIIVTTTKNEIAQACSKNCTVHDGLKEPYAKLIQRLSRGKEVVRSRMVVAISGPGGRGKSVLAELAYKEVIKEFEYKAWSRKTENGDNLIRDILHQLGAPKPPKSKQVRDLTDILKDFLKGKRYIIGIDRLETTSDWNDVKEACPDENTCSRIIVTTTDSTVARTCRQNCSVFMMQQVLDQSTAMELLVRKVFDKDRCPDNISPEDLMIFLETSEYLPLAIANIGDHMKGLRKTWDCYEECEKECIDIGSQLVNKNNKSFRGMRHVLDRSYTSLSDKSKACLLSLSLYPNDLDIKNHVIKDHLIKVKPLIRRLLAERLISPADDLANECLTPLIEHNLIVPTEFSISGHVKTFRINRMLLKFIKEKADLENYVNKIDIQQGMEVELQPDITRLYLHNKGSSESSGIEGKYVLSRVRLLEFHGNATNDLLHFNGYTFLRVLILENCGSMVDGNLDTVCSLTMLKYLSIIGSKNVGLPKNIEKILSLETLDTRDTKTQELSLKVLLLPKLANLFGEFKITCTNKEIKSFSNNKCQLQTLAGFLIYESPDFVTLLPRMPKLSKVKILFRQTASADDGSQEINAVNEEVKKILVESLNTCFDGQPSKSALRSLSFSGFSDLDFLSNLAVPYFLHSLKLCGNLTTLPKWITSQRVTEQCTSITHLCLSASNIGRLSQLQCLEKLLFLKLTEELNEDLFDFKAEYIWHRGWFKSLKRLCLDFPVLPKIVIQEEAMPSLQSLQMSCTDLHGFHGIENLLQLEELILPSAAICAEAVDLLSHVKKLPQRPRVHRSGSGRRKLGSSRNFHKVD